MAEATEDRQRQTETNRDKQNFKTFRTLALPLFCQTATQLPGWPGVGRHKLWRLLLSEPPRPTIGRCFKQLPHGPAFGRCWAQLRSPPKTAGAACSYPIYGRCSSYPLDAFELNVFSFSPVFSAGLLNRLVVSKNPRRRPASPPTQQVPGKAWPPRTKGAKPHPDLLSQ